MSRKNKQLPLIENIEITDVAAEGKAIAKQDNMVIFTQYTVPGDVVDLQITRKKNSYMEGRVVKIHKFAEKRCEAFCKHYGVCGGCKWQILPYEEQIKYKQKQVLNNLTRIGKVDLPEISPIMGSQNIRYYRNKLEFTFSNKKWLTEEVIQSGEAVDNMNALGFHIPGKFDKVLDIEECHLQTPISNEIRNEIKSFALANGLEFFDIRNQEGFLRNIIIRTASTGEIMLIVIFFKEDSTKRELLLNHLATKFPQITSLLYIINEKCNDTITDQEVHTFKGRDYIIEEMEGLKFKVGPKSFYQTNSAQAYELYKVARNFANLSGNELVYDLYTGTGTIACFVSKMAKKVVGIEYVPEAIEDAKVNADFNQIKNTLFYAGDMKEILTDEFIGQHGKPDVIITDPPRDGMHKDVVDTILRAEPQRIVYVSCNPATQARDLNLLDTKYEVKAVQPVDMFPHTHHVENVVLLTKREHFKEVLPENDLTETLS
ncbi:MAG: 23S rRNA (uracil(1939)-C(5))-methyltransferase RlmD [Paludibacteraceae bacterium]|nr:23S rRNA (uracil(1939)-C(5))-methyltransferase RlmD [Paludibacteraceae bacterium]MBR4840047.1 23S rRNA (uracil(1939)-C(5))-methyltransferase RlmD [Paludibacteraceae bacterium]